MFEKIINIMKLSLSYSSLDTIAVRGATRDFIKCIGMSKFSDEVLDSAKCITREIKNDVNIIYVFLNAKKTNKISMDFAYRNNIKYIVIFRYSDMEEDDKTIIEMLFKEARFIVNCAFSYDYNKFNRALFYMSNSASKLMMLAPYMITCKIFDELDIGLISKGDFVIQKAINPDNIPEINDVMRFIFTEHPDANTLFDLNAFLLAIYDKKS